MDHLNKEKKKIKSYTFVIEDINTNQFIGLFAQFRNKSIEVAKFGTSYISIIGEKDMEQKVNRVLDFGFNDLNLHRIKAGCAVENSLLKYLRK
jgi:RimJ/RimL family protein N-acetyltransferase